MKIIDLRQLTSFILVALAHGGLLFFTTSQEIQDSVKRHFSANQSTIVRIKFQKQTASVPMRQKTTSLKKGVKAPMQKKVKKQKMQKAQSGNRSSESIDTGDTSKLSFYLSQVQNILNKNKFYPTLAKRMGHKGTVRAHFILDHAGHVSELIGIESDFETLKEAVEELILNKAKFPKFPKEINQTTLNIVVPIVFEI